MNLKNDFKILILLSTITFAGHPLNTDDAFSLEEGAFEIEILSEFYKYQNTRELTLPVGISYGIFKNTDVVIAGAYNSSWDGSLSAKSFGDITVELKHILVNDFLRVGVKPFITLPTGDINAGFGKGKVNCGAYLLLTKEWEEFHVHSQFGYTRNNNIVDEKPDLWDYSVAIEKFLSDNLSTVFEFGIAKNCCYESVEYSKFILGGFIYQYNNIITIDLGLMKGLSESDPDFGLMTGVTLGF